MDSVCHRCGAAVLSQQPFCPHCGAPQLLLDASADTSSSGVASADGSEGQRAPTDSRLVSQSVSWRPAVAAALLVAIPVGLLSSLLDFGVLWVIAGGIGAVALYRRRSARPVNTRGGMRIGAVLGLAAALLATLVDGFSMLFERYILHTGAAIDQRLHSVLQQATDHMAQSNPEAAAQIPWFTHFWLSASGHAAVVLLMSALSAVAMVGFSAAGGALGARFIAARSGNLHRL
jgi:hypothetical protein